MKKGNATDVTIVALFLLSEKIKQKPPHLKQSNTEIVSPSPKSTIKTKAHYGGIFIGLKTKTSFV
jgi:hypothetical protein